MSLNSHGDPCVWGACFLVTAKSNKYPDYDPRTFPSVLSQKGDQTKRKYRDTKALSVNEEILVQELNELHAEPVFRPQNGMHDDEDGLNFDGDWPPPPEAEPEEPKISPAKSDSEIYTSFLTIDVSGKSEGLGFFGKHRAASLLSLLTASNESLVTAGIDAENEEQAKDDLGMISKYLSNMVLTRSQWSHNYDVLRDLVKLYIGAKTNSTRFLCNLLDYFLKLNWPGTFLNCMRKILKEYPQVFVHSSDRKVCQ